MKNGENTLETNMLSSETWDKVIKTKEKLVNDSKMGLLVFGLALNLLLFSSKNKKQIIEHLEDIILNNKSRIYLFTVSNDVFAEDIKQLEQAVDNLLFT